MNATHPRATSNPSAPWDEHERYTTISRAHPNSASYMMNGPSRQRNGYGANGEKAVPVPGYGNGGDRKNSVPHGQPLFDMARSPPTASNKSESDGKWRRRTLRSTRHETRPMQVLPPGCLPSRKCMSILPRHRYNGTAGTLQVLYEGRTRTFEKAASRTN